MIPKEKAAEVMASAYQTDRTQSRGFKSKDTAWIASCSLSFMAIRRSIVWKMATRGQDCFEVRPVMPDDELMARQTEKGFWIKWEINSKEEMVYELEV